jgi:hypothetical protein
MLECSAGHQVNSDVPQDAGHSQKCGKRLQVVSVPRLHVSAPQSWYSWKKSHSYVNGTPVMSGGPLSPRGSNPLFVL